MNEILTFEPNEKEKEVSCLFKPSFYLNLGLKQSFWKHDSQHCNSSSTFADLSSFGFFQIPLKIIDDNQWEPDEEFFVKLTLIPGADSEEVRLGRTCIMEITILNDDGKYASEEFNLHARTYM